MGSVINFLSNYKGLKNFVGSFNFDFFLKLDIMPGRIVAITNNFIYKEFNIGKEHS